MKFKDKNRRKVVAVKLTVAQWDLVTQGVFEWGALCDSESYWADGTINKSMAQRSRRLGDLSTKILQQVEKKGGEI